MRSREAEELENNYAKLLQLLDGFEHEVYSDWTTNVTGACDVNLKEHLLNRDPATMLISINFSPEFAAVLREVKYLMSYGREDIPDAAAAAYNKNEDFVKFVTNLDLIVVGYNQIRQTVIEVEYPIIEGQLTVIDSMLEKAITELDWSNEDNWSYIESTLNEVRDLQTRLSTSKEKVKLIEKIMSTWTSTPLFDRTDEKGSTLLMLRDREERTRKRYEDIENAGLKIHALLEENLALLQADPTSDMWKAYVDFIDELVVDGFFKIVHCSIDFLLVSTDPSTATDPLFEAALELQAPDLVYRPSLDSKDDGDSFYELIDGLVDDIYRQSSKVARLATHIAESGRENYQPDLEDMQELTEMRQRLMEQITAVMNKAGEHRLTYDGFSFLWVDDRAAFMSQFLQYGQALTQEHLDQYGDDVPLSPPTLVQFREQIDLFEELYKEAEALEAWSVFDKWFRVDVRPFRQALLKMITRWNRMFKQHLIDHVTNSLAELESFIEEVDVGLQQDVKEGEKEKLISVMNDLIRVKERQAQTDEMFEPLKQEIDLLKIYNEELPERIHDQLQDLPEKWSNTKKKAVTVKQIVGPLQASEAANVRRRAANFDSRQFQYRETFRRLPPFFYTCSDPYEQIDLIHASLCEMETEMAELLSSAGKFEF